jgi:1-aminocyclopropane-1-carboxylate deaminase/D-cysteine desulfhydrase-like pyridoxal-dependent ACC family enzyme
MHKFRTTTRTTKILFAAVVSSVIFAGVYGFAASLGLTSSGLGAGSAVVAACGTGTNAAYSTTYSASIPGYSVSQVNLSAIPAACLSKSYKIQLTGASGVAVGSEMSGTLPASGTTATIATSGTPDASLVTGVSVVIS